MSSSFSQSFRTAKSQSRSQSPSTGQFFQTAESQAQRLSEERTGPINEVQIATRQYHPSLEDYFQPQTFTLNDHYGAQFHTENEHTKTHLAISPCYNVFEVSTTPPLPAHGPNYERNAEVHAAAMRTLLNPLPPRDKPRSDPGRLGDLTRNRPACRSPRAPENPPGCAYKGIPPPNQDNLPPPKDEPTQPRPAHTFKPGIVLTTETIISCITLDEYEKRQARKNEAQDMAKPANTAGGHTPRTCGRSAPGGTTSSISPPTPSERSSEREHLARIAASTFKNGSVTHPKVSKTASFNAPNKQPTNFPTTAQGPAQKPHSLPSRHPAPPPTQVNNNTRSYTSVTRQDKAQYPTSHQPTYYTTPAQSNAALDLDLHTFIDRELPLIPSCHPPTPAPLTHRNLLTHTLANTRPGVRIMGHLTRADVNRLDLWVEDVGRPAGDEARGLVYESWDGVLRAQGVSEDVLAVLEGLDV